MTMDCSTCCLHHQLTPHSSGWQDIIPSIRCSTRLTQVLWFILGERVLAHVQAQPPPPQSFDLRAQPQKHYSLWLGKCVITGMLIVAHSGQSQILTTRTVTCLVKRAAIQFCGVQQDHSFLLMNVNLTIKIKNADQRFQASQSEVRGHC